MLLQSPVKIEISFLPVWFLWMQLLSLNWSFLLLMFPLFSYFDKTPASLTLSGSGGILRYLFLTDINGGGKSSFAHTAIVIRIINVYSFCIVITQAVN
jgi:hypothetical protein